MSKKFREALADLEHRQWSGWMKYMFSKGHFRNMELDGTVQCVWIMPSAFRERWERQMNTDYEQLPEEEKDSDRAEAERVIKIIRSFGDLVRW